MCPADTNGQSTLFFGVDAHDRSATCGVLLLEPGDLGKLRIAVRTLARPLTLALRFAAHKIMLPQQPLDDRDTDRDTMVFGQAVSNLLVREIGPLDIGAHR